MVRGCPSNRKTARRMERTASSHLLEVTVLRGRSTPLHRDPSDETFYLLDGEMLFHAEGSELEVHAGDTIAISRGVAHAFVATSEHRPLPRPQHTRHPRQLLPRRRRTRHQRRPQPTPPPPDLGRIQASNQKTWHRDHSARRRSETWDCRPGTPPDSAPLALAATRASHPPELIRGRGRRRSPERAVFKLLRRASRESSARSRAASRLLAHEVSQRRRLG